MLYLLRVSYENFNLKPKCKVVCAFQMVIVSLLPHAEFGPNDHREDALHFTNK